jgi:hypothetical protein
VAIGVVLVAAALIGGVVLLIAGGGSDSGSSGKVRELQDQYLKHTVVSVRNGISVRRPGNWTDSKNHGVVSVQSRDRCVAIHLSAPAEPKQWKALMRDSVKALRVTYKNVQVTPGGRAQLGGIPTRSNAIALTDDKGNRTRLLLSVGRGKKYAYVTEVVVGNPACRADVALAQIVLTSIDYTK